MTDAVGLRAMIDALPAVFWEADAGSVEFGFVSERAVDLLGYPVASWIGDASFWPSIIHSDDREAAVEFCAAETAAGRDHEFSYRALTADGRIRWLHDVVHVVCDADGVPRRLQGVMVDITVEKRAERTAALLADAGRCLAAPEPLEAQLGAVARAASGPLGHSVVVTLLDDDGLLHPVATAHVDPTLEPLLALAAHSRPVAGARAAFERGEAGHVVEEVTDRIRREDDPAPDVLAARERLGSRSALVVPMLADGLTIGVLGFATADPAHRYHDDLALGRELALRVAAAVVAHRLRERNRLLLEVTSALAAAASVEEAAQALVTGAARGLGAVRTTVFRLRGDGRLHAVHRHGHPEGVDLTRYTRIDLDAPVPLVDAVRAGEALYIDSAEQYVERYPHLAGEVARVGVDAAAVLPMRAAGAVTGALALTWDRARVFRPEDRDFAELLAEQAGLAFERSEAADDRRVVAETLQRSLLPAPPPAVARLAVARRYLPGAEHTTAGGDWYDVIELGGGRVAVAVGDVVGQGAAAAAVMGQLRSALAAYLLDGAGPADALRKLDRFSRRVPGARAATVACVVIDTGGPDGAAGTVVWASAGHVPPLILTRSGARYLEGADGCVLGIVSAPPRNQVQLPFRPGETVLLYTDGLVERRDEPIDRGLARLAAAAGRHAGAAPRELTAAVLDATLDDRGPPDDVAMIAVRLGPPALRLRLPAQVDELAGLRDRVRGWGAAGSLRPRHLDDVQLAVVEAVSNGIEHAYRGRDPGRIDVRLDLVAGGGVHVEVADDGTWQPVPADRGRRGHGLTVIHALAPDAELEPGPAGTRVRFTVPAGEPET